mgnify:CR=1 FL=1
MSSQYYKTKESVEENIELAKDINEAEIIEKIVNLDGGQRATILHDLCMEALTRRLDAVQHNIKAVNTRNVSKI